MILYLHGFASSPTSNKARAFRAWALEHGRDLEVLDLRRPSFEGLLFSAMREHVLERMGSREVSLIGSSLGGLLAARIAAENPRVKSIFLMAPAFQLAGRWEKRIGTEAWNRWKSSGAIEVDDWAEGRKRNVHFGFVEELARIDNEKGPWPDVRVPTFIVHGTQDDIVDVDLSREWARDRPNVTLVEVEDGHELGASLPLLLEHATTFFLTRS